MQQMFHATGTKVVSKNEIHRNFERDKLGCFSCFSLFLLDCNCPLLVSFSFFPHSLFFFIVYYWHAAEGAQEELGFFSVARDFEWPSSPLWPRNFVSEQVGG